jgi:hypothetical protein
VVDEKEKEEEKQEETQETSVATLDGYFLFRTT